MVLGLLIVGILVIASILIFAQHRENKKEKEYMALKLIYTLFIGVFLAIFVGVGIAAFYPGPKSPEMPAILKYCSPDIAQNTTKFTEFKVQAEQFDKTEKAYQQSSQIYSRNVSTIAIIAAIIMVVISLTLLKQIQLLADGVLLGGVLTLLYSIIRGFGTEDNMFRFIVVSVGLIISLFLGYVKFIKPSAK